MNINPCQFLRVLFFLLIHLRFSLSQRCEVVFRAFGNSHADTPALEALKNIPVNLKQNFKAYSYAQYGKLMYSMARDGFNITELLKSPKSVHFDLWQRNDLAIIERRIKTKLIIPAVAYHRNAVSHPLITEKDVLYFVSGEIDARHKIGEIVEKGLLKLEDVESSINDMVDRYIEKVKEAVEQVPAKTVWIGGLFPQPLISANNHWWSPTTGTWEQRQQRIDWINQRLKMHCEKEGYLFMDFSEGYTNPRGDLDMKMTDGNHHLLYWTEKTKNEYATRLVEHYNRVCGHQQP